MLLFVAAAALSPQVGKGHLSARPSGIHPYAYEGDWRAGLSALKAAKASDGAVKPAAVSVLIGSAGREGNWREAVEMLELLCDSSLQPNHLDVAKAFTQAIQACGRAKRWKEALAVLERMESAGIRPDAFAYNAALSACAKAKVIHKMQEVFDDMAAHGVSPDRVSYTIAMDGFARAGLTAEAIQLFDNMGKNGVPAPDAPAYSAAIAACCRSTASSSSAWQDALRILKQMMGPSGPGPSIKAVSGAMAACTNARQHKAAIGLFNRLGQFGLHPDAIACSTAIAAHSRLGEYREALRLFSQMRRRFGVPRDTITYNTMLHACAMQSQRPLGVRHAARIRSLMAAESIRADDITYSVLLQSLWHTPLATDILDEAIAGRPRSTFGRCLEIKAASASNSRTVNGTGEKTPMAMRKRKPVPTPSFETIVREESWIVDLHDLSPGAAVAMVLWVLSQIAKREATGGAGICDFFGDEAPIPKRVALVTGWGRHGTSYQFIGRKKGAVRGAVLEALSVCGVPIQEPADAEVDSHITANPGLVELDTASLTEWVWTAMAKGLIRGWFDVTDRFVVVLDEKERGRIEAASHASI